jgi:hypothetical protein
MSSLVIESQAARAKQVATDDEALTVDLVDGRTIVVPLGWYPRLWHRSPAERQNYELLSDGEYIHWPDLDEDLTVAGLLAGHPSRERPGSLKKWLESRNAT